MRAVVPEMMCAHCRRAAELCDGVALADTVGYANPAGAALFAVCAKRSATSWRARTSTTAAIGLANALAAREGVRGFDSSMAASGCPFAPGASGNVITRPGVHVRKHGVRRPSTSTSCSRTPDPRRRHPRGAGVRHTPLAAPKRIPCRCLEGVRWSSSHTCEALVRAAACRSRPEVIKVEPLEATTRGRLEHAAPASSRSSIATRRASPSISSTRGTRPRTAARRAQRRADRELRPGALDKLGFSYSALAERTRASSTARSRVSSGALRAPSSAR